MGDRETAYQRRAMLCLSKSGCMFRNNVGIAQHADGSLVAYGLCKGSSDLIGWETRAVTQDDVGRTLAVFRACEVKTPTGRLSAAQRNFLAQVRDAGGVALVAVGDEIQPYEGDAK